jgi:uncharacterized membrane protein YozB (DUF420 family)
MVDQTSSRVGAQARDAELFRRFDQKRFPTSVAVPIRTTYFIMLISHVILAATVPVLASVTIYWGLRDRRDRHLKWARWTYPIWLYVSVTGVLIYVALYHVFAVG